MVMFFCVALVILALVLGDMWFHATGVWSAGGGLPAGSTGVINQLQADIGARILVDLPYSTANRAALDYAHDHDPDLYRLYIDNPMSNPPPAAVANAQPLKNLGDSVNELYERYWNEVLAAARK